MSDDFSYTETIIMLLSNFLSFLPKYVKLDGMDETVNHVWGHFFKAEQCFHTNGSFFVAALKSTEKKCAQRTGFLHFDSYSRLNPSFL